MKFSIRDMLLVTVIVALALGWWLDKSRLAKANHILRHPYTVGPKPYYDHRSLPNSSAPAPNPPKDNGP
jgi:hypothetical protein